LADGSAPKYTRDSLLARQTQLEQSTAHCVRVWHAEVRTELKHCLRQVDVTRKQTFGQIQDQLLDGRVVAIDRPIHDATLTFMLSRHVSLQLLQQRELAKGASR
jgi:multidrug efflux pump subunit AcrA (membrane-fusion protein)